MEEVLHMTTLSVSWIWCPCDVGITLRLLDIAIPGANYEVGLA
jgi:hypothetical protein